MAKAKIENDSDGWWAYYIPGWKSADDPVGIQHQDRADTKREILQMVREAVPCDCADCKAKQQPRPMTLAQARAKARERRRVLASWNGNPDKWLSERQITKLRANKPKE